MQSKKPRDRILFTATLSYDWTTAILNSIGGAVAGAVEVRVVETWVPSWTRSDQYIPRLDFEQITQRDRFGSPAWEAARISPTVFYALLYALQGFPLGEGAPHLVVDHAGLVTNALAAEVG